MHSFYYTQINSGHKDPASEYLNDYCDGLQFQSHPLISNDDDKFLQIVLYYDELEICNPLGSRRKKHKIGNITYCVHMTLSKVGTSISPFRNVGCMHVGETFFGRGGGGPLSCALCKRALVSQDQLHYLR